MLIEMVPRDFVSGINYIFQDRITVSAFNGATRVGVTGRAVGPDTRVSNTTVNGVSTVVASGINENALPTTTDGNVEVTPAGPINSSSSSLRSGNRVRRSPPG